MKKNYILNFCNSKTFETFKKHIPNFIKTRSDNIFKMYNKLFNTIYPIYSCVNETKSVTYFFLYDSDDIIQKRHF